MFSIPCCFGVSNIQNLSGINKSKNLSPNFRGVKPLENDTNDFSSNVRKTKIKDMAGNDVNASVVKNENDRTFYIYANGNQLGYAHYTTSDYAITKKFLLQTLHTQEHLDRSYKGAGTELLKSIVNESINEGYNGKVNVTAAHGPISPMLFYYKNNFVSNDDKINAYLQYAIENNLLIEGNKFSYQQMELDENGAKAFLDGQKLYKTRSFEKICEENIDGEIYSMNLIQSPKNNTYSLLMVNEDSKDEVCYIGLEEKKDSNGKKHYSVNNIEGSDKYIDCAMKTLENIVKDKGYDKTTVQNKRTLRKYPSLQLEN